MDRKYLYAEPKWTAPPPDTRQAHLSVLFHNLLQHETVRHNCTGNLSANNYEESSRNFVRPAIYPTMPNVEYRTSVTSARKRNSIFFNRLISDSICNSSSKLKNQSLCSLWNINLVVTTDKARIDITAHDLLFNYLSCEESVNLHSRVHPLYPRDPGRRNSVKEFITYHGRNPGTQISVDRTTQYSWRLDQLPFFVSFVINCVSFLKLPCRTSCYYAVQTKVLIPAFLIFTFPTSLWLPLAAPVLAPYPRCPPRSISVVPFRGNPR